MFTFKDTSMTDLFQWSIGVIIVFSDESLIGEKVHFSNDKKKAISRIINKNLEVEIPNCLLQKAFPIEVALKEMEQDIKIQENTSRLDNLSTSQAQSVLTKTNKYTVDDNGAQFGGILVQGGGSAENPTAIISSQTISAPNISTNQMTVTNFVFQQMEGGNLGCFSI